MSTMMMSTIPNKEMGNATGLGNMLRNIGGSIGISMATTALIRRAALHQTEIGANLTPSTAVFQQKSALIAAYLGHRLGPAQARPGSFGLLYGLMEQQSALHGLRRCLPLDRGAGLLLRRRHMALQEAQEARRPASRGALRGQVEAARFESVSQIDVLHRISKDPHPCRPGRLR